MSTKVEEHQGKILAKVYRLILDWPDPDETASTVNLGGEAVEAGRELSSSKDDAISLYHPGGKNGQN